MHSLMVLTTTLVSLGAVCMLFSIVASRRIRVIPVELLPKWKTMTAMMGFFLAGYLLFIVVQLFGIPFPLELLTAAVFLVGALFVCLFTALSRQTINQINHNSDRLRELNQELLTKNGDLNQEIVARRHAEEQLRRANDRLEIKVEERTCELKAALESLQREMIDRMRGEEAISQANMALKQAQSKILQQDKMASIGQLAAGVAHEINNPIGFISSNLNTLNTYVARLLDFLALLEGVSEKGLSEVVTRQVQEKRRELKLEYIVRDISSLIDESLEGTERVRRIVQDLKSFSRLDEAEEKLADINAGLESTINMVWNELKHKASVHRSLGEIPQIRCNPGQLNQVFMNLLINAANAIETFGEINVQTRKDDGHILITVSDTGFGMPKEVVERIFEPFFTTKEVGKGTGLGLSIAYDIVKKHKGEITVDSRLGQGTTFAIRLPCA